MLVLWGGAGPVGHGGRVGGGALERVALLEVAGGGLQVGVVPVAICDSFTNHLPTGEFYEGYDGVCQNNDRSYYLGYGKP